MKKYPSFATFCGTKLFIAIFLFSLLPALLAGQVQVDWINVYPDYVNLKDAVLDHDGNLIIVGRHTDLGNSTDLFTMKIDPDGNTLWVASYDSAYHEEHAAAVCLDADDNIYITGDDYYRGFTFKYSKNGSLLWKVYSGYSGYDNFCDSHSDIYVAGNDTGVLIRKYDSAGTSLGSLGVDSNNSFPHHIQLNKAGDIFIGGTELISSQEYFFCEKYDSNGIFLWHTRTFQMTPYLKTRIIWFWTLSQISTS